MVVVSVSRVKKTTCTNKEDFAWLYTGAEML